MGFVTTGIRLEKKYTERLEKIAKLSGKKKTYYMRKAIVDYLDQVEPRLIELSEAVAKKHGQL